MTEPQWLPVSYFHTRFSDLPVDSLFGLLAAYGARDGGEFEEGDEIQVEDFLTWVREGKYIVFIEKDRQADAGETYGYFIQEFLLREKRLEDTIRRLVLRECLMPCGDNGACLRVSDKLVAILSR